MKKAYPKTIRSGAVTVKIYKTKSARLKSGYIYQVSWIGANGRTLRQFADPLKADAEARHIAENLAAGRAGGALTLAEVDLLTTIRELADNPVDALSEWKRASELCRGNLIEAARQWQKDNPTDSSTATLDIAIRSFKAAKQAQGVNVKLTYKTRLESLSAAFPGALIRTITTRQLNGYLQKIDHPVSRNTHRKNIVTLFSWCRKNGYIANTARTSADDTDRADDNDKSEIGICNPSTGRDVLRLIQRDHPHYLAALVLGMFCGLRRDEIHNQKWSDIDLQAGHLQVSKVKPRTPADRFVEIPKAGIEWLMLCGNREGDVCGNLAQDRIRDIGREAGFDLPPNCFRHSAIAYKMATGLSAGQVAAWAGTSEKQIHKHYRRPRPRKEGEAWFALSPSLVLRGGKTLVQLAG